MGLIKDRNNDEGIKNYKNATMDFKKHDTSVSQFGDNKVTEDSMIDYMNIELPN